jgi:hypothetical protein
MTRYISGLGLDGRDATVLVVGRDWADRQTFEKCSGRDDMGNPTNRTLVQLLTIDAGFPGLAPVS